MKYAEAISAFETRRASLVAANDSIMESAANDGATLDDEQKKSFDSNAGDVAEIDEHLTRLRQSEKALAAAAVPVVGNDNEPGGEKRNASGIVVKTRPKAAPGIEFARLARCFALAQGIGSVAADVARSMYGERFPRVRGFQSQCFGRFHNGRKLDRKPCR